MLHISLKKLCFFSHTFDLFIGNNNPVQAETGGENVNLSLEDSIVLLEVIGDGLIEEKGLFVVVHDSLVISILLLQFESSYSLILGWIRSLTILSEGFRNRDY